MILVLPIAFIAILQLFQKRELNIPDNLAKTLLVYNAIVVLFANLLSIGSLLNKWTVLAAWICVIIIAVIFGVKKYGKDYFSFHLSVYRTYVSKWFKSLTICEYIMLFTGTLLVLALLYGAIFTVPYNYDSMTYHLARIGYWMDHGNVNYYITNVDRQLFSPVLSEYNMLYMMLLSGNDVFLNLQQFIAMLVTAYYLYKVARKLHTGRAFSGLGAFIFLSMPLTITQSITTQNDLSTTMWFAIFLYYLVWFVQAEHISFKGENRKKTTEMLICIGASVGFAFLMKISVCASMIMFMPWFLICCICRKDRITDLLRAACIAGITLLVVISETLIRTYMACGSFIADTTSGDIMVATKNVSYIIVNIMKNFSLLITQHLWTGLNGFVYRIAISTGQLLHVEVNNVAISFHGFDFVKYLNTGDDMYSHDRTSSAFVAYFALLAGVLLVISLFVSLIKYLRRSHLKNKTSKAQNRMNTTDGTMSGSVSYGFVISAWLGFGFIMALLRWQPWGSRLMYPALSITIIAGVHMLDVFFHKSNKKGIVIMPLALLSMLLCLKPLSYNLQYAGRFLKAGCTNRNERYFVSNSRYDSYEQLKEKAMELNAEDIAVVISGDGYDYPLWKIFHDEYPKARLRHILVDDSTMTAKESNLKGVNVTGKNAQGMAKTTENPDCIFWIERGTLKVGDKLDYHGVTYTCVFVADSELAPDSLLVKD